MWCPSIDDDNAARRRLGSKFGSRDFRCRTLAGDGSVVKLEARLQAVVVELGFDMASITVNPVRSRHSSAWAVGTGSEPVALVKMAIGAGTGHEDGLQNEVDILSRHADQLGPRVLGSGHEDGIKWTAQKWLGSASVWERTEPAEADQRKTQFGSEISAALAAIAHLNDCGVVHGDIQSRHLLFDDGRYHVIDLESSMDLALSDRGPSRYKGGFLYFMAPEVVRQMRQEQESIRKPTVSIDVYSSACMAYLLWARKLPWEFDQNSTFDQKAEQILNSAPASFASQNVQEWRELEEVVLMGLSSGPEERWSTVDEFRKKIDDITGSVA